MKDGLKKGQRAAGIATSATIILALVKGLVGYLSGQIDRTEAADGQCPFNNILIDNRARLQIVPFLGVGLWIVMSDHQCVSGRSLCVRPCFPVVIGS